MADKAIPTVLDDLQYSLLQDLLESLAGNGTANLEDDDNFEQPEIATRLHIFGAIAFERDRQDILWGGAKHDADHTIAVWKDLLDEHVRKFFQTYYRGKSNGSKREYLTGDELIEKLTYHLVAIAALAVAALEQIEARNPLVRGEASKASETPAPE